MYAFVTGADTLHININLSLPWQLQLHAMK